MIPSCPTNPTRAARLYTGAPSKRCTLLSVVVCLLAVTSPLLAGNEVFDARGFQPNRNYFGQLPYEHIDPLTGNLLLTFTDLVLPGNAGFDLVIQRTYNSKIHKNYQTDGFTLDEDSWAGVGWTLHLGRVMNPWAPVPGPIEMPDGSRHKLFNRITPDSFGDLVTRDFWVYKNGSAPELRLTNGLVYTFGHSATISGTTWAYVTEIRDPYGNTITVQYMSDPADGISSITQDLGSQSRTVTFTADSSERHALERMQYQAGSKTFTWDYTHGGTTSWGFSVLTEVEPPTGPSWQYSYWSDSYELKTITTPHGGTITYTYESTEFYLGQPVLVRSRAVVSRATGGRAITSGTWSYEYAYGTQKDQTIITAPCNKTTVYRFFGVGNHSTMGSVWKIGLLAQRTTKQGSTILEDEAFSWATSPAISQDDEIVGFNSDSDIRVPRQTTRTVTRGSTSYTTAHTYAATNFGDYGRPNHTDEDGSIDRQTDRGFWYGASSSLYIKDRTSLETVSVGGESFTRSWGYNSSGFRTSETNYGVTTSFAPTSRGNVASSTNANSHTTTYTYDWGVLENITPEVAGTQTTRTINPEGTVASETRRGLETSFVYDGLFRETKRTPALGNAIVTSYDNSGGTWRKVTRGTSPLISVVTTSLDGFGRPTGTTDSEGVETTKGYDTCDRTSYESLPFQPSTFQERRTTFSYDALDRIKRRTNPDATYVSYDYLTDGIDVTITDEEQREHTQYWSAFGDPRDARLVSVKEPETSATTTYSYNAVGSLTRVNAPVGGDRVFNYNAKNQLTSESQPESGTVSYTYYGAGNLKTRADEAFGTTTFTYDGNERLTGIGRPGTAYDTTIGYDGSDNRTLLQNSHVKSTFHYDNANRLDWRSDEMDGLSFRVDYGYHANDWLTRIDYPSGRSVVYTPDTMGRVESVTNGGSVTYANQFAYHPSGAVRQFMPGGARLQTFGYDPYRYWLTSASTGHRSMTYGHDDVGNVLSITETRPGRTRGFDYDALDRLTTASGIWGSGTYHYDAIGNRTTSTVPGSANQTYNSTTNRMASAGATTYGYDANGNLTKVDGATVYAYTATNMLQTAPGVTYRYDGDDMRKMKVPTSGLREYFIHGPGGQILSHMTPGNTPGTKCALKDYVYVGSRLLAAVKPALPTVAVTSAAQTVMEGPGATALVTVRLTTSTGCAAAGPITVNYATANGSAIAGEHYVATNGTLTFPGTTVASGAEYPLQVNLIDNSSAGAATRTFSLVLSSPTGAVLGTSTQTITIQDNDVPIIAATKTKSSGGADGKYEQGERVTYTVVATNSGLVAQADNAGHELTDDLPSGLTLVSAVASSGAVTTTGNTVAWDGGIAAGGSVTLTIQADITAPEGTTVSNLATAYYDSDANGVNDATITTNTVSFTVARHYGLTALLRGEGAGSVESSPAGLSCGSTCSASFLEETPVTLTATPAAGSSFAGWSGACLGSATTCQVSMSAAQTVVATFDPVGEVTPVVWTSVQGATANGNSLNKTATTVWGNAGAISTAELKAGDGAVRMTVGETNTRRTFGLGHGNTDSGPADLEYGLLLADTGELRVLESGAVVVTVGTYQAGDLLKVAVESGAVNYYQNETLLHTSTVTVTPTTYPLVVDTALYTQGATLTSVVLSGTWTAATVIPVTWTNIVGATASGNNLTKTAGTGWNAGAVSTLELASGDGSVTVTASETTTYRLFGLSHGSADANYTEIDFGLDLAPNSVLYVYENGVQRLSRTYVTGDRLEVAAESGVVKYKQNGVAFHTSAVAPVYPLLVDTSLYTPGATLTSALLSGDWSARPTNVALNKTATQSSTYDGKTASRAVDGNTNGVYANDSVSHTNSEAEAWWQVDLGSDHLVSSITLFNRTDCCGDRLSNYDVFLLDASGQPVWSIYEPSYPNPSKSLAVGGVVGRTVRVQLRGTNYLALAEVQVIGHPAPPRVGFAQASQAVSEGAGSVAAIVTLTTNDGMPTTEAVSVNYAGLDGTAVSPSDYALTPGTLTFPVGTASGSSAEIPIAVIDDTAAEGPEGFGVQLTSPAGCVLGLSTENVTIADDDVPVITATKALGGGPCAAGSCAEGDYVIYTISLSNSGLAPQPDNAGHELVDVLPRGMEVTSVMAFGGGTWRSYFNRTELRWTVYWDGVIPAQSSVLIKIEGDIRMGTGGQSLSNQATAHYDSAGTGTNDATVASNVVSIAVLPNHDLTVSAIGAGSLDLTADPYYFNTCNPTCTASFPEGTVVTVAANPAVGWQLSSWAGACSGSEVICQVTMDESKTAIAVFDPVGEVTPVVWTSVQGATANGNSLTKTATTGWGNAGAISVLELVSGDGGVRTTVSETTTDRMIGLSHGNSDTSYTDIDFALYAKADGALQVYEAGVLRATLGTYSQGDLLQVSVESGMVEYRQNGTAIYTSTVAPVYPLVVDTALYTQGATLSAVVLSGTWTAPPGVPISWTSVVGATASGNNLVKTATTGWGNAGAISTLELVSGNGAVRTTVGETNTRRVFGLGHGNTDSNYTDLEYGLLLTDTGELRVLESGTVVVALAGTYQAGDLLKVAVESGAVNYYQNNTLLYTSTVTPVYPLVVDTALYTQGATLNDVMLSGAWTTPSAIPVVWTELVGVTASGNSLAKTAATAWNAGAVSTLELASGDGSVTVTASETTTYRLFGLSHGSAGVNYTEIDFGLDLAPSGKLYVYENGVQRVSGTYATGDLLQVSAESGVVKYKQNGVAFYTSAVAPAYPLLVDTALYTQGATLSSAVLRGTWRAR